MSVVVTGGAGFIGSCIVRALNDRGIEDILVVDHIASTEKWRNLRNKKYSRYIPRDRFLEQLPALKGEVTHVIHMGACSATTESNFDYLYSNNFEYTQALWSFCAENQISYLYAGSAATYGDGKMGFDDREPIERLLPLNGYGYSKQLFDVWAQKQEKKPLQHVGFKFFNVYGPNEYFKGSMASMVFHGFHAIRQTGQMNLFRSYKADYADGGQLRDFIYVKDICRAVLFMMDHPEISGLFNLGTGKARTFYDLGVAIFAALQRPEKIAFIEMPEALRPQYQYFTEAKMDKLRQVGYTQPFYSLEDGVKEYVQCFLEGGEIF